jgi:hypothetical protein
MAIELTKLGASVEEGADYLRVTPPATARDWRAASIHTYDDHRVAMCFSLAAFNPAGLPVRIEDPQCVAKTFPDYFEALFTLVQPSAPALDGWRHPISPFFLIPHLWTRPPTSWRVCKSCAPCYTARPAAPLSRM